MANQFQIQKLIDTQRRAVIKVVGTFDSAQTNTIIVQGSTLAYALNVNNKIMVSNTHPRTNYRFSIKRIFGDVKVGSGYIKLQWHNEGNTEIAIFSTGEKDLNMTTDGGSSGVIVPPDGVANARGNILLSSYGTVANDHCTLIFDIAKNGSDYDMGQTADPAAFNR